jgi:hypothetical protein
VPDVLDELVDLDAAVGVERSAASTERWRSPPIGSTSPFRDTTMGPNNR